MAQRKPPNITKKNIDLFIEGLNEAGGRCGNKSLRERLNWEDDYYWKVQGKLIASGIILPGRGQGGSVIIAESEDSQQDSSLAEEIEKVEKIKYRERDLYAPLKASIESKWINRFGFDSSVLEETHSQGSKLTGGTYTRPDITAAGVKRYVYLPRRLEIVTFEVKSAENVSVMGVLEAISHREAAHRAYVIYGISRAKFDNSAEAVRITELGQKYGIGIILADDPSDVENWDVLLDAVRNEPDPGRLDRFLGDLPNDAMKKQLSKWKD